MWRALPVYGSRRGWPVRRVRQDKYSKAERKQWSLPSKQHPRQQSIPVHPYLTALRQEHWCWKEPPDVKDSNKLGRQQILPRADEYPECFEQVEAERNSVQPVSCSLSHVFEQIILSVPPENGSVSCHLQQPPWQHLVRSRQFNRATRSFSAKFLKKQKQEP